MHGRDPASVYRQRWRWNAVQTAHQGYPLIGISTSSTILSPARYRPGSIKSPIPWRASRWLRLQGRPRAHQSEPAPSRVDIGFLACIVIVHPSNQRATTAATSTTEGARTENVSAAKVSEGADTGRGDTLKENLRKDIEAWYRDAGKYTESLINVVHLPRTVCRYFWQSGGTFIWTKLLLVILLAHLICLRCEFFYYFPFFFFLFG